MKNKKIYKGFHNPFIKHKHLISEEWNTNTHLSLLLCPLLKGMKITVSFENKMLFFFLTTWEHPLTIANVMSKMNCDLEFEYLIFTKKRKCHLHWFTRDLGFILQKRENSQPFKKILSFLFYIPPEKFCFSMYNVVCTYSTYAGIVL